MAAKKYHVVHYLNTFFAGLGGEESTGLPFQVKEGAVGMSQGVQAALGEKAQIVATIVCGDNYFSDHLEETKQLLVEEVKKRKADVFIAGPAFGSGRYGFACAEACQAVAGSLGIPCVTALHPENPGVETYRSYKNWKAICLPTTETVAGMGDILSRLGKFALRMAAGEAIGPARQEGYIPRGLRRDEKADRRAFDRALDMLEARFYGRPFQTEIPIQVHDFATPAPAIKDIKDAKLAIVSTAGIVPWGNPDRFVMYNNQFWKGYSIAGQSKMEQGKWEAVHGGVNAEFINGNPNLGAPLDVLREMEDAGEIGAVHDKFYSVCGSVAHVTNAKRWGREIAQDAKVAGVNGIIMVST